MKFKNKILVGIFALNLSFVGLGASAYIQPSYAVEASSSNQRAELQRALDDVVNVVNSEVYFNYASQNLKANYEDAIKYGEAIISKEGATSQQLRDATKRINKAKKDIYAEAELQVQKIVLDRAVRENEIKASTTRMMMTKYPKTVAGIRPQLEQLLVQSENLIAQAKALLAKL